MDVEDLCGKPNINIFNVLWIDVGMKKAFACLMYTDIYIFVYMFYYVNTHEIYLFFSMD